MSAKKKYQFRKWVQLHQVGLAGKLGGRFPPRFWIWMVLATVWVAPGRAEEGSNSESSRPNVIFIVADDLGYGDLSCYGQSRFTTPNIDQLAEEGLKFSQHYSGNTVCSPSRASLMTGLDPGRVNVRGNIPDEDRCAPPLAWTTLAELFQRSGYRTGAFGKWGLGITIGTGPATPGRHGFDEFVGWKSQLIAHTYYPSTIVKNGVEYPLDAGEYIHDLIMDEAFAFIREQAQAGEPFFCFIPTAIPHAAMHAPEALHRKWRERLPQFEDEVGTYGAGPDETCPDVRNPVAGFAAMMEHLDNNVGTLLDILEEYGIDENTLILFSSDNGPHAEGGHKPEYWNSNGDLRGMKRDLYEGGIRVPLLARWKGTIQPGASDHVSAFWDFVPTFASLLGQSLNQETDGISLLPTFLGSDQAEHDHLYWEFWSGSEKQTMVSRAIRMGKWKAVQGKWLGWSRRDELRSASLLPLELYDLETDPGETVDISQGHPEIVETLLRRMEAEHQPYLYVNPVARN